MVKIILYAFGSRSSECMYDGNGRKTRKRHDSFPRSPDGRRAILAFFLAYSTKKEGVMRRCISTMDVSMHLAILLIVIYDMDRDVYIGVDLVKSMSSQRATHRSLLPLTSHLSLRAPPLPSSSSSLSSSFPNSIVLSTSVPLGSRMGLWAKASTCIDSR